MFIREQQGDLAGEWHRSRLAEFLNRRDVDFAFLWLFGA